MKCEICKSDKNIIHHHLSYEPEIITTVCRKCHTAMHRIAEKPQDQQDIIIDWIKQYGHLWKGGAEKLLKTEYYKNYLKEHGKSKKHKDWMKKYKEELYFKSQTPEKILERLEKMEKFIEHIEKYKP